MEPALTRRPRPMSSREPAEFLLPANRNLTATSRPPNPDTSGNRLSPVYRDRVDDEAVLLHVIGDLFEINHAIVDFLGGGAAAGPATRRDGADSVTDLFGTCLQRAHGLPPTPKIQPHGDLGIPCIRTVMQIRLLAGTR